MEGTSKRSGSNKGKAGNDKVNKQNREAAVVTYFFLIVFLAMIAYFIYFMIAKSDTFINSPYNSLQNLFSERVVRGDIVSADGEVLATTVTDADGNETRKYPYSNMFAHVVGYASNGKFGLESQENFDLLRSHTFFLKQIVRDLKDEKQEGDTVVTTLRCDLQEVAYEALGSSTGAVIALKPSTGEIVCMVSKPDFDPNTIAADWDAINADSTSSVLVNRATQGKYAPGSAFKIVTLLEYYRERGQAAEAFTYDCDGELTVDGRTIYCASGKKHGEQTLKEAFAHSCNGAFAQLSLSLDLSTYAQTANDLLFNQDLPIALESSKSSFTLDTDASTSLIMETGIGQGNTLVSPLHMALIVSAIANDGTLMRPYLVERVESTDGAEVSSHSATEYGQMLTTDEAAFMQDYLRAVVLSGTASSLSVDSYTAYGKTGTAQVSDSTDQTNAWFVGYASKSGYDDLAIAVVVEGTGAGSTAAVPIAKKVFDEFF